MKTFRLRALLALLAVCAPLVPASAQGATTPPRILVVEFANDINPVTQDYVNGEMERAERDGYSAVVIELDTPGGLDSSMRAIIKKELALRIPVVVYVAPAGSRAASAGAFITMAADLAAMAPQTNIGSATPVTLGGEDISKDLRNKIVNDATEYIEALADEHGRNGEVAKTFVTKGSNLDAREARDKNIVEIVAATLPGLLERIDGERTQPKGLVLRTRGAEVERVEMGRWKQLLDLLIDPNVIVLLMSLGVLGIVIELWNPGLIFPGAVGGISLIVGLYGLQVLPISWAGIFLMLLALGFFGAELFLPSHGALALAGSVCFVIGSLMLFDPAGEAYQVSLQVSLAIAGTLALFFAIALAKVAQARRRPVEVGVQSLVGTTGVVRRDGYVLVNGELWRARTADGVDLPPGQRVTVEHVSDDLELTVRRVEPAEPAAV